MADSEAVAKRIGLGWMGLAYRVGPRQQCTYELQA